MTSGARYPIAPRLRQLTSEEVEFVLTTEPEETPAECFIDTDDPTVDRADEDGLLTCLDRGEVHAWCTVVVTASWTAKSGQVHTGTASLGCCVLTGDYTAHICADEEELIEEALESLNKQLAALVSHGQELTAELAIQ